jgi:nucleoside-diphosphate-sugar epimerase
MNKQILICGNRSFVADGLETKLSKQGFEVDCFTRGAEERIGNQVTGDVFAINSNNYLKSKYDFVINFIVIKDKGLKENIDYIKSLVDFCKAHGVKNLIQVSSIMVYDNNEPQVDETTPIETNSPKKGYGEIKIEVDKYLASLTGLPFSVSFIRPGYVLAEERQAPFVKILPMGFALIKGDAKSIMPIVKRESIHTAIANMLQLDRLNRVYLFVPSTNKTKYQYAKENHNLKYIFLYKWLILGIAGLFVRLGLMSKSFYVRIEGMYIETRYNSTQTEKELNIKF